MKSLSTKDLPTFLQKKINQTYHPIASPLKHAEFYAKNSQSPILDIGFGLGYVAAASINLYIRNNKPIELACIEKDKQIIKKVSSINIRELEPGHSIIKQALKNHNQYNKGRIKITIITGDARKAVKRLNKKFSTIFLDGFSPNKNPELYTLEFLELLKTKLNNDGIILCHSQNPIFRTALKQLNFKIGNLEQGTIAGLSQNFSLEEKDEKLLKAFRPFRDPKLNWSKEKILKEWDKLPMITDTKPLKRN